MTHSVVIKNALIVNEGTINEFDLRIRGQHIDRIDSEIKASHGDQIVEACGLHLLPGMIDDQVHFREPGLSHKGTIASESRAAVAGGITSYMEMPNVKPPTTSIEALENKFAIAEQDSTANYSFYLGATENNLDQIKRLDPKKHCGVKVFMGASTGDLLVEHPHALDAIFCESPALIATHCESGSVIEKNIERLNSSGKTLTILDHPIIRDTQACFASSSYAVDLAKKHGSQLHVLHITTEKELSLFEAGPIENKHITAEVCVHHLWFSDQDYSRLGNLIKCNPSIKSSKDRDALMQALYTNQIDIIATDHAPHTLLKKLQDYMHAPAGLPLVEQALLSLLESVKHERLALEQVVEKMAHNPAKRYMVEDRGFVREGYYADLVLVDMNQATQVRNKSSRYHCGWTPFDNYKFTSKIQSTWVNGQQVFNGEQVIDQLVPLNQKKVPSKRLAFNR